MTPELKAEVVAILREVAFESRQSDPGVGIYPRPDLAEAFEQIARNVELDLDRVFVPLPARGETLGDYFKRLSPEQQKAWELHCTWTHTYAQLLGAQEGETIFQATERVIAERDELRARVGGGL